MMDRKQSAAVDALRKKEHNCKKGSYQDFAASKKSFMAKRSTKCLTEHK